MCASQASAARSASIACCAHAGSGARRAADQLALLAWFAGSKQRIRGDAMNGLEIIRPAIVLALFTLAILLLMGIRRACPSRQPQTTTGSAIASGSACGQRHRRNASANLLGSPVLFSQPVS